jgi:hypothetical protein
MVHKHHHLHKSKSLRFSFLLQFLSKRGTVLIDLAKTSLKP